MWSGGLELYRVLLEELEAFAGEREIVNVDDRDGRQASVGIAFHRHWPELRNSDSGSSLYALALSRSMRADPPVRDQLIRHLPGLRNSD
jgi:hypothetical protein